MNKAVLYDNIEWGAAAIFMNYYIICSVITFSAESAISASKQCYHPPRLLRTMETAVLSLSVPAVNWNTKLKTATQNFKRLTTPSKRLRGHGVGYTKYYNGTLRVTYKSKLTLGSFKASCGGGHEGGGVWGWRGMRVEGICKLRYLSMRWNMQY